VQENVGQTAVRNYKSIALGSVEPLDNARNLNEIYGNFLVDVTAKGKCFRRSFRPHPTASRTASFGFGLAESVF
jgi:hypothetical protein